MTTTSTAAIMAADTITMKTPKNQVVVLFDADHIAKESRSTLKTTNENINNKRKINTCCDNDGDDEHDCCSAPALSVEDDILYKDDYSYGDDNASMTACYGVFELRRKKKTKKSYPSDLIVVLDMDECLIHFETEEEERQSSAGHQEKKEDEDDKSSDGRDTTQQISFMHVGENKVLFRPGLINFLKFVTARYETHIFTAGTKVYADSILDQLCLLIGDWKAFAKRWYREDCETIDIWDPFTTFCIDSIYVKPLSKVAEWAGRDARDLGRIVHVDDRAKNFLLNHNNGIQVSEWRGDPDDNALSKVKRILQKMDDSSVGDVRPHFRKAFSKSYSKLKDHLDMMNFFPYRRTKGIESMAF